MVARWIRGFGGVEEVVIIGADGLSILDSSTLENHSLGVGKLVILIHTKSAFD
jgi:hypothetical protein